MQYILQIEMLQPLGQRDILVIFNLLDFVMMNCISIILLVFVLFQLTASNTIDNVKNDFKLLKINYHDIQEKSNRHNIIETLKSSLIKEGILRLCQILCISWLWKYAVLVFYYQSSSLPSPQLLSISLSISSPPIIKYYRYNSHYQCYKSSIFASSHLVIDQWLCPQSYLKHNQWNILDIYTIINIEIIIILLSNIIINGSNIITNQTNSHGNTFWWFITTYDSYAISKWHSR